MDGAGRARSKLTGPGSFQPASNIASLGFEEYGCEGGRMVGCGGLQPRLYWLAVFTQDTHVLRKVGHVNVAVSCPNKHPRILPLYGRKILVRVRVIKQESLSDLTLSTPSRSVMLNLTFQLENRSTRS